MRGRWLINLPADARLRVLLAMRTIRARSDSEVLAAFRYFLFRGMTPDEAALAAQTFRVRAICAWNASRADDQFHRSVESESGLIDRAREDILRAVVEADTAHVASAA